MVAQDKPSYEALEMILCVIYTFQSHTFQSISAGELNTSHRFAAPFWCTFIILRALTYYASPFVFFSQRSRGKEKNVLKHVSQFIHKCRSTLFSSTTNAVKALILVKYVIQVENVRIKHVFYLKLRKILITLVARVRDLG